VNNSNKKEITPNEGRHLHIICLDVPYPVDYGGVFDLFYKIKSLSEAGIKIHLHCFEYGRGQQTELNNYCVEVNYYSRITGVKGLSPKVPYIVSSRANKQLLANLKKDDYPLLMEGMHCTYFLKSGALAANRCFVRLHNVEFEYYKQLAETSQSFLKKVYFKWESWMLKRYEASLANKATFWSVTEKDMQVFVGKFGYKSIDYLPLFLPTYKTQFLGDFGTYCLYHGNLSVPENEQAVIWLQENVFKNLAIPFYVAGKNPSHMLAELLKQFKYTTLKANPTEVEMEQLIRQAQINILPSLNSTGIKLKLINALYKGKHCLVNKAGVEGSGLDNSCTIANSGEAMQNTIHYLFDKPFTEYAYNKRISLLHSTFNNEKNARQILSWVYEGKSTFPGSRTL
jgi:hypothetical protein